MKEARGPALDRFVESDESPEFEREADAEEVSVSWKDPRLVGKIRDASSDDNEGQGFVPTHLTIPIPTITTITTAPTPGPPAPPIAKPPTPAAGLARPLRPIRAKRGRFQVLKREKRGSNERERRREMKEREPMREIPKVKR